MQRMQNLPKRFTKKPLSMPKKQEGFIQNLILPGLILLGAIVAVVALMSNGSSTTDTSKEQAGIYSSAVLAQGVTMKEAVQRAIADGVTSANLTTSLTVLTTNKYIASNALPTPPRGSEATGATPAWTFSNLVVAADGAGTDLGTAAADDVLLLSDLNKEVCVRINNKLYGETVIKANDAAIGAAVTGTAAAAPTIPAAAQASAAEGCLPAGSDKYTYYKVVHAK